MRILVAPDCFTGTLTAPQAAEAMARGWRDGAPSDDVDLLPLSDGGPGFLEVVRSGLGGELVPLTVPGPRGEEVPACILLVPGAGRTVAYVEVAQAAGLHLLEPERRDPAVTTSRGVGALLRAAVDSGADRVVVGVGGTATNDAGAGVVPGLSESSTTAEVLGRGGAALASVAAEDLAALVDLRAELAGLDLVAACDVDVPLLGLHGASAGFAAQKGADDATAQELERALGHYARVVAEVVARDGRRRDLLAGEDAAAVARRLTAAPGAGAGGGLGFGLAALGARLVPGAQVVAEAVGLAERVAAADLVLTGEGTVDWQSLHGKVVHAVAAAGLAAGVPVVAVAGQVHVGRREWGAAGLSGAYAVAERPGDVPIALADPAGTLAARTTRVARTWSP